jgi:hypothetical protein
MQESAPYFISRPGRFVSCPGTGRSKKNDLCCTNYINDNDWMVNEKRKGRSGILNGKIYGGFIFDLK